MRRLNEETLRSIIDSQPGMTCRFRADGTILFANRAYADALGVPVGDLEDANLWRFVTGDDRARVERQLAGLSPATPEVVIENRFETASGPTWTRWKNRGVEFDADGRWLVAQSLGEDISDRKANDDAIRAARSSFQHLVENSPFGVYAVDGSFRLRIVSAGAQKVFASVRPLIGRDFAEVLRILWQEPFASEAIEHFRRTLETGEPYHAAATTEPRQDVDAVEAYDWKIERTTLPDGTLGVVCHFYDLSERLAYQRQLQERETRLRLAIEAADAGEWESDPRSGAFLASDRALALHGLPTGAQLTHEAALGVLDPEDQRVLGAAIERTLATGEPLRREIRIPRAGGETRWLEMYARRAADDLKLVGLVRDITEKKRSDVRQQLLVDELSHRVKNTLALVQAMAQQTFKADASSAVARRTFEDRLGALAAAHATLTSTGWEAATLGELVRAGARVCGSATSRITMVGPEVRLTAGQTVPLAMMIHELCTNAIKYGALSDEQGSVQLGWHAEGAPPWLCIDWRELGGPKVSPPQRRGFGSMMLERAVVHQLNGRTSLTFEPGGVRCIIEVPLQPHESGV